MLWKFCNVNLVGGVETSLYYVFSLEKALTFWAN